MHLLNQITTLSNQMMIYKQSSDLLLNEEKGDPEQKIQEAIELSDKFIKFDKSNEELTTIVNKHIKEIASIRPGRKLLKSLSKFDKTIEVKKKREFEFQVNSIVDIFTNKPLPTVYEIGVTADEYLEYIGMDSEKNEHLLKRPAWVGFGHELVHAWEAFALEELSEEQEEKETILFSMHNGSEQHTVTGFRQRIFTDKDRLDPMRVLCENTFLLYAHLPPRTRYYNDPLSTEKAKFASTVKPLSKEMYYVWLEQRVYTAHLTQLPINKVRDKLYVSRQYLFNYIVQCPIAVNFLAEEWKENREFILDLVQWPHINILPHVPKWCADKQFMLEAIRRNRDAKEHLSQNLKEDENFMKTADRLSLLKN
ncbi:MAG: DUF4116 domain-containing protein [Verrucomicrobia bacterium]|nr:DUF4116 domain-containing protein [Verrucomicrobiota bacterium]